MFARRANFFPQRFPFPPQQSAVSLLAPDLEVHKAHSSFRTLVLPVPSLGMLFLEGSTKPTFSFCLYLCPGLPSPKAFLPVSVTFIIDNLKGKIILGSPFQGLYSFMASSVFHGPMIPREQAKATHLMAAGIWRKDRERFRDKALSKNMSSAMNFFQIGLPHLLKFQNLQKSQTGEDQEFDKCAF